MFLFVEKKNETKDLDCVFITQKKKTKRFLLLCATRYKEYMKIILR